MCKDSNDTVAREPYLSTLPGRPRAPERPWRLAAARVAAAPRRDVRAPTNEIALTSE